MQEDTMTLLINEVKQVLGCVEKLLSVDVFVLI
jgi:hypothetical protein